MRNRNRFWLAGVLCAAPWVAGAAPPDPSPVDGVWVRHERHFTYMGVTSLYSCDGLEDKLKTLLQLAGAREDLVVRGSCTEPRGGPSRMASAWLTYYALALPGSPQATATHKNLGRAAKELKAEPPAPGAGQWKSVELKSSNIGPIQDGDCELVEQFDHELLADFTTRNHESRFNCVPHQVSISGIRSRFEVLAPLPKVAKPK
jgi:hypothetical protein